MRLIGVFFLVLALTALLGDFLHANANNTPFEFRPLGQAVDTLSPGALRHVEVAVERHVEPFFFGENHEPWLWRDVIFPYVVLPSGVLVFGVAAGVFFLLSFAFRRVFSRRRATA